MNHPGIPVTADTHKRIDAITIDLTMLEMVEYVLVLFAATAEVTTVELRKGYY